MALNHLVCRVCDNTRDNVRYEAREMMYGLRERFMYFQCGHCQCLQIEEFPAELGKFYPTDYDGYKPPKPYKGLFGLLQKLRHQAALGIKQNYALFFEAIYPARYYQFFPKSALNQNSKILDVGCGRGSFLYPLYELGITHMQGIDPFIPSNIEYPNGYRIEKKYIHEVTGCWDAILYNHAFEHVPDPLENLLAVERLLTRQGTCILRIPTVSSYAWKHYRTDWFQLDAPRHFYLHSVKSLGILAEQANLKIIDVVYDSTAAQFKYSESYQKDIAMNEMPPRPFSAGLLKELLWRRQARKLNRENRGDQAIFFLKKKQESLASRERLLFLSPNSHHSVNDWFRFELIIFYLAVGNSTPQSSRAARFAYRFRRSFRKNTSPTASIFGRLKVWVTFGARFFF